MEKGPRSERAGLPQMQLPLQDYSSRTIEPSARRRLAGIRRIVVLHRPSRLQSEQTLQRHAQEFAAEDWSKRGGCECSGKSRRPPRCHVRDGKQPPRRLKWVFRPRKKHSNDLNPPAKQLPAFFGVPLPRPAG